MIKPTLEEVRAYIKQEGYNDVNPVKFWNYYESIGWVRGKARIPITRWRSCFAQWTKLTEDQRLRYKYKTCAVCGKPAMMIINGKGYCKDSCFEKTRPIKSDKQTLPVSVKLQDVPAERDYRKELQRQKIELLGVKK
jgi:hypothetical protein